MARTPASPTSNRSPASGSPPRGSTAPTGSKGSRQSVRNRILSRTLVISIVPLMIVGMMALISLVGLSRTAERNLDASREGLAQDVVGQAVQADAADIAREVDRLVGERVDDVLTLAATPAVWSAARRAAGTGDTLVIRPTTELESEFNADRRLAVNSNADRFLRATARQQPAFAEIHFTERNGLAVAASARTSDFVQSDETWWNQAWDNGLYLGEVAEDESSGVTGLTIAARIDRGNNRLGVVKAVVDIGSVQQAVTRAAGDDGTEITVLSRDGQFLADTASDHDSARIMTGEVELSDERANIVERATQARQPGFALGGDAVAGYAPLDSVDGRLAELLSGFDGIDSSAVQWTAVVEQPTEVAFAPLAALSEVQRSLSDQARTFGVVMLVTLIASLIAAFVVSTRLAQRIVQPLQSLGATAHNIADNQLPALVRRAQVSADRDEDVGQLPKVELHTDDEIEDVADAFNVVSATAVDLAAEQARNRRNVSRMFVNLGRRNQSLLNRQLEFIDRLERDTADPDLLDDLFRLDHLATRMRRNAESLLVLAGEEPARRWSDPVSLTTVVRGAVAEVEDYRRITIDDIDEAQLVGSAVADVTHLVAELIENAAQFSPPDTPVAVVGRRVIDGYTLAVVDDGVGMSDDQLADANRRIATSPQVEQVPSGFLGLFVVGRLAARHGIRVRLMESTTAGVTAKVLLPDALIDQARTSSKPEPEARAFALPATSEVADGTTGRRAATDPPVAVSFDDDTTQPIPLIAPLTASADADDDREPEPGADAEQDADGDQLTGDQPVADAEPVADREPDVAPAPQWVDITGDVTNDDRRGTTPQDDAVSDADVAREDPDDPPGDDRRLGVPRRRRAIPVPVDESDGDDGRNVEPAADAQPADDGTEPVAVPADWAATASAADRTTEPSPTFEVRRRTSKRNGDGANGHQPTRPAVLRTERSRTDTTRSAAASHGASYSETDESGVTLTDAEREARAARDRLARFQSAVRRGRSHARQQPEGGEHDDA